MNTIHVMLFDNEQYEEEINITYILGPHNMSYI
jgi:hypothetical protein